MEKVPGKSFWNQKGKHILHCCFFFLIIIICQICVRYITTSRNAIYPMKSINILHVLLYLQYAVFLVFALPYEIFNFLGLICFNAFPKKVQLKSSPNLAPFICVRVVTRGDCPELVKKNTKRNLNTCLNVGMQHFVIEVVTEKILNIESHPKVKETVIPSSYKTKSGARFKARNLQYCLDGNVNFLHDSDWIVHLDEDSLLTSDGVRGILNFVVDGRYPCGQGVITYCNDITANWFTTLADGYFVTTCLMGRIRFLSLMLHRPLYGWAGTFMVIRTDVEKDVSFDHGLEGSISEDIFFAMNAYKKGYRFNFIEGELKDQSSFTLWDFLQQRKRWIHGLWLLVRCPTIPLQCKALISSATYCWILLPFSIVNIGFQCLFSISNLPILNVGSAFILSVYIYGFIYPVLISDRFSQLCFSRYFVILIGAIICSAFLNLLCEIIAIIWFYFDRKYEFYVVSKENTTGCMKKTSQRDSQK